MISAAFAIASWNQTLQFIAWLLAVVEVIIGLYTLVLNSITPVGSAGQRQNNWMRHIAIMLFLTALVTFGVGVLIGGERMQPATIILAAAMPAVLPTFWLTCLALIQWDQHVQRSGVVKTTAGAFFYRTGPQLAIFIPVIFTLLDATGISDNLLGNVRLWYTGPALIDSAASGWADGSSITEPTIALPPPFSVDWAGGFIPLRTYTGGVFETPIILACFLAPALLACLFLLSTILRPGSKKSGREYFAPSPEGRNTRALAGRLLVAALFASFAATLQWISGPALSFSSILFMGDASMSALAGQTPVALLGGALFLVSSLAFVIILGWIAFQPFVGQPQTSLAPSRVNATSLLEAPRPTSRLAGSLQVRLTVLILIVVLPLFAAVTIFLTIQAQTQLERDALQVLDSSNQAVTEATALWLNYNVKALETLVNNPDIYNMIGPAQKPVLAELVTTYPHMYLSSTTDLTGMNVARSDDAAPVNYADRRWYNEILTGSPVVYDALIGRTSKRPALVVSMPIQDPQQGTAEPQLVGVGMFASELSQIEALVGDAALTGETGAAGQGGNSAVLSTANTPNIVRLFLVDDLNQLIAHSDPSVLPLQDMSAHPAVQALRTGVEGAITYQDQENQTWRADISVLPNNWGVVAEQNEAGLFAPVQDLQRLALAALAIGSLLLFALSWFTLRQGLHPVQTLTDTAAAIRLGDLSRLAPIESQDELGTLAASFNTMTTQLNDLIRGLEERVAERTGDLERRLTQLQVTSEVAREASAIRNPETLLQDVVRLISERFGFYHAGIFLLEGDEVFSTPVSAASAVSEQAGQLSAAGGVYAVLKAASSEGGQRMLARRHRLRVGQVGMVGNVAATGRPRIALDVGKDAEFFNNPDLPETRSEMALPLKIQEQVIGVLDVQSRKAGAFTQEDLSILQILADQVALAIENARLLSESRQALRELEGLYGMQFRQGWKKRLAGQPSAYVLDSLGIRAVYAPARAPLGADEVLSSSLSAASPVSASSPATAPTKASPAVSEHEMGQEPAISALSTLEAPIELRGRRLGTIRLKRDNASASAVSAGDSPPFREGVGVGREETAGDSEKSSPPHIQPWTEAEQRLLRQATAQLALSLENARLLEEVQNRAGQEELINQIVARIQSSLNLETVMRTSVQEIGRALNAARVRLRLGTELATESAPPPPIQQRALDSREVSGMGREEPAAGNEEPEVVSQPPASDELARQRADFALVEDHPAAEIIPADLPSDLPLPLSPADEQPVESSFEGEP